MILVPLLLNSTLIYFKTTILPTSHNPIPAKVFEKKLGLSRTLNTSDYCSWGFGNIVLDAKNGSCNWKDIMSSNVVLVFIAGSIYNFK